MYVYNNKQYNSTPYKNHHQSVLSTSINGQTSFWFNMLHCNVPSLIPHNSIKACVKYVHDLFTSANRIFTLLSRCERPENQSFSHTLYLYDK